MKKFISLLLAILTFTALFASCGQPADTTDTSIPETDEPETNAPETNPPVTDESKTDTPETNLTPTDTHEVPSDPTFDPDEKDDGGDKKIIFEYDFTKGESEVDGFTVLPDTFELSPGEGYKTAGNNGSLRIKDNNIALKGKSIMVEGEITFDVLPHKADGVTNFPLSIISWIRKDTAGNATYDWIFKMDDSGTFYIKNTTTPSAIKAETGKRYTFGVLFDENKGQAMVYLDGELVGAKGFSSKELTESAIRFFDGGLEKAHFSATLHAARAYLCNSTDMLKDAEKSVYDVVKATPGAELCFVGLTDKDALSYKVGEEMNFEIYLTANGEVVSAPYFYYSVEGEDGQAKTEGYVDGSKGHFTVKAKMSKPGAVRVKAYICDENKVKQTKNNSQFYIDLETSTPQKADLRFQGGAIAGFDEITVAGMIPDDLAEFWNGVINDCYRGDIKVLRFDELDPTKNGGTNSYNLYLVEIEAADGFATGYLSVPKNTSSLKLDCGFVSYGNAKKPKPEFKSGYAIFNICAHSYHLDDPNAKVPDKNGKSYGFYMPENNDRDTTYFKNMLIRNIIATRFLKAYIGDGSYGRIVFGNETIAPLNKWKVGDEYFVNGGSQASFQSVAMAALDNDVTTASFGVPWFCDVAGPQIGRFKGWKPDYTDALMYYDSCALATLIEDDVDVTITGGLGDVTSEPSSVIALYNAIKGNKKITMTQNRDHTYNPPISTKYSVSKGK